MRVLVFILLALIAGCSSKPKVIQAPAAPSINFTTSFVDFDRIPAPLLDSISSDPILKNRTSSEIDRLRSIKRILDRQFTYKHDYSNYGKGVAWRAPSQVRYIKGQFVGDLKDYAVLARAAMAHVGLPARLAMTGRLYDRQFHVVCISEHYAIDRLQLDVKNISTYELLAISRPNINAPWILEK
ncbi:hypothetical protein ACYPKM_03600 [Pseudomonas aeruginosa]